MVEENKKMLKVEIEVVKKSYSAPGFPRRSPNLLISRTDDA